MEWSLKDFYASGGTTTFVDRLCGSLGIHASTVKIVGVYEGSLIIDYQITGDSAEEVAQIKQKEVAAYS